MSSHPPSRKGYFSTCQKSSIKIPPAKLVLNVIDLVDRYCENNGIIAQAKELTSYQWSKHILRWSHLIKEIVNRGDVQICKIYSNDNIAGLLMKSQSQ